MDNIELRSRKVRRMIGPIPEKLFVSGVVVTVLIAVALIFVLFCLTDPVDVNKKLFHIIISSLRL